MNIRILVFGMASLFLISACSSVGVAYKESAPVEALTEIVRHYGKGDSVIVSSSNGASYKLPAGAARDVVDEAKYYCRANEGVVGQWSGGISCTHSVWSAREIFVLRVRERSSGIVEIDVAEKRQDDNGAYQATVNAWGYETIAQRQSRHHKALEYRKKADEAERESIRKERLSNRHKVAFRGAKVCQESDYDGRKIVFVGTVEQVEGDRIKVFVERSYFFGAPGLMPGNFQQHYAWVNVWDVTSCS